MDNNYISFRKARVGGFNKKDVINYIEKMRNDFYDYKKAVEATVDSLNAKIRELEALNDNDKSAIYQAAEAVESISEQRCSDPISDINASALRLRMVADELCRNLTDFMTTVSSETTQEKAEECSCCDADCANTESQEENIKTDKAAEILARSVNFSFLSDDAEKTEEKSQAAASDERKSVLDTLYSSAFFN